jgi:hypothetical protein
MNYIAIVLKNIWLPIWFITNIIFKRNIIYYWIFFKKYFLQKLILPNGIYQAPNW